MAERAALFAWMRFFKIVACGGALPLRAKHSGCAAVSSNRSSKQRSAILTWSLTLFSNLQQRVSDRGGVGGDGVAVVCAYSRRRRSGTGPEAAGCEESCTGILHWARGRCLRWVCCCRRLRCTPPAAAVVAAEAEAMPLVSPSAAMAASPHTPSHESLLELVACTTRRAAPFAAARRSRRRRWRASSLGLFSSM